MLDAGVLTPIDQLARAESLANIHPQLRELISFDGGIATLPVTLHGNNWTFYNAQIMEEFGLTPPSSWAEFFTQMEQLQEAGHKTIAIGEGIWEHTTVLEAMLLAHGGKDLLSLRHSGVFPDAKKDNFRQAIADFIHFQSIIATSGHVTKTWDQASLAVAQGQATVQLMGDWAKGEMIASGYQPGADFLCTLAPGNDETYIVTLDSFALPHTTQQEERAGQEAFVDVVLDPVNHVEFSRIKGSLPVVENIDRDALDICGQLGFDVVTTHGYVTNQNTASTNPSVDQALHTVILRIMKREVTDPEEAVSQLINLFEAARGL